MDALQGRKHVRIFYGRPARFMEALGNDGATDTLFVGTEESFTAGEQLLVEVHLRGAPNAVWLDAQVLRVRRRALDGDEPAGVSMSLGRSNARRLEYLSKIAVGEVTDEPTRRRLRTPVLLGADIVSATGSLKAWVRDISQGGACISCRRVPDGVSWSIEIHSPFDDQRVVVPVEVCWRTDDHTMAGVRFRAGDARGRVELATLVSRLESSLEPLTILA